MPCHEISMIMGIWEVSMLNRRRRMKAKQHWAYNNNEQIFLTTKHRHKDLLSSIESRFKNSIGISNVIVD